MSRASELCTMELQLCRATRIVVPAMGREPHSVLFFGSGCGCASRESHPRRGVEVTSPEPAGRIKPEGGLP